MKLSIIVPAYNEEKTINQILDKLSELDIDKEVIVVDDKSSDGTLNLLKGREGIVLLEHEENKGKGAAVKTGLKVAEGDVFTIQDADLEYDPKDFLRLLQPILANKASVAYGSRFLDKKFVLFGKKKTILPSHWFGNKFLTLLTRILFRQKITDMETCYKMFRKEVIEKMDIKSNGFDFEPEITAKIVRSGNKIKEIPISYAPRGFDEGKKITVKDGFIAVFYLFKYRFFD